MGDLNNIFSKLNIMEQSQLNKYINVEINTVRNEANERITAAKKALEKDKQEIRKYYEDKNTETWKRIEASLYTGMRENHVSNERIDKIFARVKELNQKHELLIGEETKSEYKILEDKDWQKMIELLADVSCKNCKEHSAKCEVYPLLKKYKVPYSGEKGKCKYAYFRIGKKVV